jgi:nucleoside phosphorylase
MQLEVSAYMAPIACSTMVINRRGYFEDTIRTVNRQTAAVEIESYGVARVCQSANGGATVPIIFKSVMDHTAKKTDFADGIKFKKFAAHTSALFLKHLLEEVI